MDGAIKKLNSHWLKDHPDNNITDFCYLDIGVEHDDSAQHDSRDDSLIEESDIKNEPEIKLDEGINPAGYIPLQLSQVVGPFRCAHARCSFTCNSSTMFRKHWNLKHSDMAASAAFIDQSNSFTVSLYQVYTYIVQCPASKLFSVIMVGIGTKNAKQRTDCLDELGGLFKLFKLYVILNFD